MLHQNLSNESNIIECRVANGGDEMVDWIKSASPADIGLAIELGIPSVERFKVMAQTMEQREVRKPVEKTVVQGQIGEQFVETILRKKYGDVSSVAKVAKSGDVTLYVNHQRITIEVKNYSNTVGKIGVEKFQRDLDTTNASGGVFISLNTPIANIATDFALIYESVSGKTVPCVYVVSSDPSVILTAVSVVSSLIQSFIYLNTELYARDKVVASVYDISDGLDSLARARNEFQTNVSELTCKMMKTSEKISAAEGNIRTVVDSLRSELFVCDESNLPIMAEMENNPTYARNTEVTKGCVRDIMECIQKHIPNQPGCMWKFSAKKCMDAVTGMGFGFYASKIEVIIPRTKVTAETLVECLNLFGKKVSIGDNMCIVLDVATQEYVCKMINLFM